MTIEVLRDAIIIALGIIAIGALVLLAIIAFSLYVRVRRILNSVSATSSAVERIVSAFEQQGESLSKMATIIQSVRQGFTAASQFFKGGQAKDE
jgi:uncharacterized protein YoxC